MINENVNIENIKKVINMPKDTELNEKLVELWINLMKDKKVITSLEILGIDLVKLGFITHKHGGDPFLGIFMYAYLIGFVGGLKIAEGKKE